MKAKNNKNKKEDKKQNIRVIIHMPEDMDRFKKIYTEAVINAIKDLST